MTVAQIPTSPCPLRTFFYSLNVILGFAVAGEETWKGTYDLPLLLQENARRIFDVGAPTYAIGMALWASAALGVRLEDETAQKIRDFICRRAGWDDFRAQDLGMILTGIAAQKSAGNAEYDSAARALFSFLKDRYLARSGLFYDSPSGFRRHFASFATQVYLTTACYHYGQAYENDRALHIADTATQKLISLQGPNGEWPWFYCALKGHVVDNYEVYSVHQDGMAALFLSFAEARGVPGARDALIKGFNWIFGANQLGKSMLLPELGMFYRSIIRNGELKNKGWRIARAVLRAALGQNDPYISPDKLGLRRECRSYELGWVLYSFGNRTDLPEITHHRDFVTALQA